MLAPKRLVFTYLCVAERSFMCKTRLEQTFALLLLACPLLRQLDMRLRCTVLLLEKRSTKCKVLNPFAFSFRLVYLPLCLCGFCSLSLSNRRFALCFSPRCKARAIVSPNNFVNLVVLFGDITANCPNGTCGTGCKVAHKS